MAAPMDKTENTPPILAIGAAMAQRYTRYAFINLINKDLPSMKYMVLHFTIAIALLGCAKQITIPQHSIGEGKSLLPYLTRFSPMPYPPAQPLPDADTAFAFYWPVANLQYRFINNGITNLKPLVADSF
jgi:hypothetical protein